MYHWIYFAVSPYLKTLSMVASTKLLHLLEVRMISSRCTLWLVTDFVWIQNNFMSMTTKPWNFPFYLSIHVDNVTVLIYMELMCHTKHPFQAFSTPWFLYASPTNHHLVFFLLEVFNNIIQYQFDGISYFCFSNIYIVLWSQ